MKSDVREARRDDTRFDREPEEAERRPAQPAGKNVRPSLADAAGECLMLIQQVRLATAIGDPQQLRTRTLDVLKRFERTAREAGYESDQVQVAKFALVAFLDEAVIGVPFAEKEAWTTNPLQAELFGLNSAGEEFFKRLGDLRQRPQANIPVLEVYYLCMVLGFKGK